MKKMLFFSLSLILLVCVTSCGINFTESDQEDEGSVESLVFFSSMEEFISAIESPTTRAASNDSDLAQLSALECYFVPQGIPLGYSLGKILAGSSDIAFYYYPTASLVNEESMMLAEATRECFEFRFRQWDLDNPLNGIMEQIGKTENDFIANKYIFDETSNTYYWVESGKVLSMTLPLSISEETADELLFCEVEIVDTNSHIE